MDEPEYVDVSSYPLVADERWLYAVQENGSEPHEGQVPGDSWLPINLRDLDEQPPVQPTLGQLGLVYPGKRHVFSGPQESAKTLAAYVIGLAVIREGGTIVLIDFEMGKWDARTRFRELGASSEELGQIAYLEPWEPANELAIRRLVERDPTLVIVDAAAGAYDLQGLDDNKRADVERFTRVYVRSFWLVGIATIVLDHVVKNVEGRGRYAIGSERKVGGADVHLGFEVVHPIKRGARGTYKIVTHKDRGGFLKRGKLAEFELVSDPDSHQITWQFRVPTETDEEHPFRPTVKMEQASRWLEKQMEEKVPMSHIETGIGGDREAGRLAIQLLVDEGYFDETPGPRNARLMTVVRPYREDFDDLSATSPHLSDLSVQSDLSGSPLPYRDGEHGGEVSGDRRTDGEVELSEDDGIPF